MDKMIETKERSIKVVTHNQDKLTVVKHNNLNSASYHLPLDARRLIISAISKIHSKDKKVPDEIEIHSDEFAQQWGLKPNNAYKQLKDAREKLYNDTVRTKRLDTGEVWDVRWLDAAAYQDGKGYIKLSFSERIKPYLSDLQSHFTSYRLNEVRNFKSTHAIRIYELLMQFKDTGWYQVEVQELKHMLDVSDKYKRWAEFRRNVVELAVKEINKQSTFDVSAEYLRKGRSIKYIRFTVSKKPQTDMFYGE